MLDDGLEHAAKRRHLGRGRRSGHPGHRGRRTCAGGDTLVNTIISADNGTGFGSDLYAYSDGSVGATMTFNATYSSFLTANPSPPRETPDGEHPHRLHRPDEHAGEAGELRRRLLQRASVWRHRRRSAPAPSTTGLRSLREPAPEDARCTNFAYGTSPCSSAIAIVGGLYRLAVAGMRTIGEDLGYGGRRRSGRRCRAVTLLPTISSSSPTTRAGRARASSFSSPRARLPRGQAAAAARLRSSARTRAAPAPTSSARPTTLGASVSVLSGNATGTSRSSPASSRSRSAARCRPRTGSIHLIAIVMNKVKVNGKPARTQGSRRRERHLLDGRDRDRHGDAQAGGQFGRANHEHGGKLAGLLDHAGRRQ